MEGRHLKRTVGVGLAVALVQFACASQKSDAWPAITATRSWDGSETAIWRNTELHPVGQPAAFDAVVVGIVSVDDDKLFIVGLDPANGGKLWQQPITPSSVAPGVAIRVKKVDGNRVAYFRPTGGSGRQAELVVADARTGRDLAKSSTGVFSSGPRACANGTAVCVLSRVGDVSVREFRLEIATGRYRVNSERLPRGTRSISDAGLLDLGDRPDNTLGLLRNGVLQWRTSISSAFPSGFSTDNGWSWDLFADHRVIVGSVYGEPSIVDANRVWDLARTEATAGLSEATGEVLWRDRGSAFHCHMANINYPVRCRESGVAISSPDAPVSYKGLQVTVEGFDVATGMTTWSVPMGATMALTSARERPIAGATQVIVDAPAGPVVLDYATGKTHAPIPGATYWCMTSNNYTLAYPYQTEDGPLYKRSGGELAAICDAHRQPATALPSTAATIAAGAQVGGYAVIATHHGYVGLDVSQASR
jgi:outer membrane protein assembly factor BamB